MNSAVENLLVIIVMVLLTIYAIQEYKQLKLAPTYRSAMRKFTTIITCLIIICTWVFIIWNVLKGNGLGININDIGSNLPY